MHARQLDAIRTQCQKEKKPFRYPGTCREKGLTRTDTVIRIRGPKSGETCFTDLIRGPISIKNSDMDDWVILRPNGAPTYNFCVVIDDSFQKITHVLRGEDHINNTPKQMVVYEALGLPLPHFAHLPMILGSDRSKLSKRHGAASTLEYRGMGFLPLALINFLVRLGWSHGDQEIFTLEELKKYFAIEQIGKANAVFSMEKLTWMGGKMMEITPATEVAAYLQKYFSDKIAFLKEEPEATFIEGVSIIQGKVKNVLDLIDQLECLFGEDPSYDLSAVKSADVVKQVLGNLVSTLETSSFTKEDLETRLRRLAEERALKFTDVAQAVRFAMTGGKVSPGLFEMLCVQGKNRVLRRVQNAVRAFGG